MPSPHQLYGALSLDRRGWSRALRRLVEPAVNLAAYGPHRQPAAASSNDTRATWFELATRPLWGLAAHAAGGGQADASWDAVREALSTAVDPGHAWFVGAPVGISQRIVESAAVGYALAVAPHELWDPLTGRQRDRLAAWLSTAVRCPSLDNNWNFFPVLAAAGLRAAGIAVEEAHVSARLDRAEQFAVADGWYADGHGQQRDYYNPFAFHYYGLLLAALGVLEEGRAERLRQRAVTFATQFVHWFAADGSALPFGRSLGYRFGQGSFWTALAVADLPALPWEQVRGLADRHLTWWWQRPILDEHGLLTVGYAYPNTGAVEQYIGGGSPYWGTKIFAALAVSENHPFWKAPSAPPEIRERIVVQPAPAMVLRHDRHGDVVAINGQSGYQWARGGAAKAAKFAYSTLAGFSVPTGDAGLTHGAYDSALAVSDDGVHWRVREDGACVVQDDSLELTWAPWPDVTVHTTLRFDEDGHTRVHRIVTGRELHTAEGGFCVPWTTAAIGPVCASARPGHVAAAGDGAVSWISDRPDGERQARDGIVVTPTAGSNVLFGRTALPTLSAVLPPGEHTLRCTVHTGRQDACDV